MKAMVLKETDMAENSPLELVDYEKPQPDSNEVLLKVRACGVCHTDLHTVEGEINANLPIIPGHEVVAEVIELGENVENLKKGNRVGVAWLYSADQQCKYCLRGQENLCENAKFTGFDVNGGYAEYMISHKDYTYKLPSNIPDLNAAPLMCAGVIGYRSFRLSEIKEGETLGLYGFGASAHIVIQIANHLNIDSFVFTRSKNHQEHARELGAKWVGTSKDDPPKKIDRAIMFAPAGPIVLDVLRVLDKGGTLAINAIYLSDIPPINWDLLYDERKITSVANVMHQDATEFLKLAGEIPIETNVSEYKLEDANQALIDVKNSNIDGAAVLKIK